jgi:hypothetical protein
MKSFASYFLEKLQFAVIEPIEIVGAGKSVAKVDTGNEAYNVLHGVEIEIKNNSVRFKTVNDSILTRPLLGDVEINIGSGNMEKRPVVQIDFVIKGKKFTKPFSLADRSTNDEPILLGELFLSEIDAVVDVNLKSAAANES